METDFISKKELLELTGISYGQLYRWKRKNLIPEEWFIRKSTFTGQETFFPREKILARVNKVLGMKEDLSLDDLADVFSPSPAEIKMGIEELTKRNIVTNMALEVYWETSDAGSTLNFDEIFFIYVLNKMLSTGEIGLDEGRMMLSTLKASYRSFADHNCELIFLRKMGISTCLLLAGQAFFEQDARIIARHHLPGLIEELKLQLQ